MTILVQNTATTNTFDFWRNRTNELAYAMSNSAVTVNSNTAVGNAAISGTMTANLFSGNVAAPVMTVANVNANNISANIINGLLSISIGNVSINTSSVSIGGSVANVVITSPTAAQVANGDYYLAANGTWALILQNYNPAGNGSYTTSGFTTQIIDSYQKSSYNTVDYLVSVVDNTANNRSSAKIMVAHDGYNAFSTEYATYISNNVLGIFSAGANGTHVQLYFSPSGSTSTTVKFSRLIV